MTGELQFEAVCRAADPEDAVASLGEGSLRELIAGLEERGAATGIPGLVLGLAINEAADRWCRNHDRQ